MKKLRTIGYTYPIFLLLLLQINALRIRNRMESQAHLSMSMGHGMDETDQEMAEMNQGMVVPTPGMTDSDHSMMDMGAGLTVAQSNGNFTAMEASGASGNETELMKNLTINGVDVFAMAELVMGLNHPRAWHVEHCRQIPYFQTPEERLDCVRTQGWYYDVAMKQCMAVSVPCNDVPTLNFWESIDGCLANCTVNGKGIAWPNAVSQTNVDPRIICTQPVYNPDVSSSVCTKTFKSGSDDKVTLWTYDSSANTCYKVQVDCHWQFTNNTFSYNSTCQHMCHDVTNPGSDDGHHIFLPGQSDNQTVNGLSLLDSKELIIGFKNDTLPPWDPLICKQIPYYDRPTTKATCPLVTGYFYNITKRACSKVTVPCGAIPTRNFFIALEDCQKNCSVNGKGYKFKNVKVNADPRDLCTDPVYDPTIPWLPECDITDIIRQTWTYDARRGVCASVSLDCHAPLTNNVFTNPNSCKSFCYRISLPNATYGIHYINASWTGFGWDPSVTQAPYQENPIIETPDHEMTDHEINPTGMIA